MKTNMLRIASAALVAALTPDWRGLRRALPMRGG